MECGRTMDKHECISQGVKCAREGDYNQARICFEEAIDQDPDFAYSWHNLATLYFDEEKWAESLPFFAKAIELDPLLQEPYLTAGWALSNMGRDADAIRVYDQGLTAIGDDPGLWYNKGCALITMGKTVESIAAFDHVLSLDPADRDAAYNRDLLLKRCSFQGFCQVFDTEECELITKQGEIYSFNGMNFVTMSVDNPGLPLIRDCDETIHYDVEDEGECSS